MFLNKLLEKVRKQEGGVVLSRPTGGVSPPRGVPNVGLDTVYCTTCL